MFWFFLSPLAHISAPAWAIEKLCSIFFSPWRQNRTLNNQESDLVYKNFVGLEGTQRVQLVLLLHQVIPDFTGLVQTSLKVFQG